MMSVRVESYGGSEPFAFPRLLIFVVVRAIGVTDATFATVKVGVGVMGEPLASVRPWLCTDTPRRH